MHNSVSDPYKRTKPKRIAVRLVKKEFHRFGPPRIRAVSSIRDREYTVLTELPWAEETEAEYFFHIEWPHDAKHTTVNVRVHWPQANLRAVICDKQYVAWHREEDYIWFTLDTNQLPNRIRTMNTTPHIAEPGLIISVEQHVPERCAGQYAKQRWPETQIHATNNYMFASREVARALGIPRRLHEAKQGRIRISGFETNNPPHPDAPPHWHFIVSWPHWYGGQAPHLYVDEHGRHVRNKVTIDGLRARHEYGPGEWAYLRMPTGEHACALLITEDGSLAMAAPDETIYMLTYDDEARVCRIHDGGGTYIGTVRVRSDVWQGRITVEWERAQDVAQYEDVFASSYVEVIHFDSLTGQFTHSEVYAQAV